VTTQRVRQAGPAAIYCRVSTERQAIGDKTSLDRQEKNCRRTADKLGLTVNENYVIKEAHSGSDPEDRDELKRLHAAAEHGQIKYVIMDVIDRTTRAGIFDFVDICKRFQHFHVEPIWASIPELDLTDPHDQKVASDKAYEAFIDKENIARRFQEGKSERMENGLILRAYMCYGYRWNAERPRSFSDYEDDQDPRTEWVLDEEAHPREDGSPWPAQVVRRIFAALAEGYRTGSDISSVKIAAQLTAEGIPTPSQIKRVRRRSKHWREPSPEWSIQGIIGMVKNPTYKGTRPQHRWEKKPRSEKERRERGLRSSRIIEQRPESDWKMVAVPPLVDEQTWEDANRQLQRNRTFIHRQPRRFTTDDLLLYGGYVRCVYCNRALAPWRFSRQAKREVVESARPWYYQCPVRKEAMHKHPYGYPRILARDVDRIVWAVARRLIKDPDYLRSLLTRTTETWSPDTQIAYYDEQLKECDNEDRQIATALKRLGEDADSARVAANLKDDAKKNATVRENWLAKRADAVAEKERRAEREQRLTSFIARAETQSDNLDDLTADQRRSILLDLGVRVHIADHRDPNKPRGAVMFYLTERHAQNTWDAWDTWEGVEGVTPLFEAKDKQGHRWTWEAASAGAVPPFAGPLLDLDEVLADFSDLTDEDLEATGEDDGGDGGDDGGGGGQNVVDSNSPSDASGPEKLPSSIRRSPSG
jgi:DNA invertase Pin-like site-specific DNA recombinase